jgi:hypothetical protein
MLNKNDLLALAKVVAKADSSAPTAYSFNGESFSYDQLNDTLRKEFLEYAADYRSFCENKNLIFAVIEETLDEVLPKKVEQAYAAFAEVKTFAQGDKPVFRRKLSSRQRAKQFITRVGLAGVYEVFKLGGTESFEVATSAIGGAAQIGFEEFLDGRADFAELTSIVMEGMDDLIYQEVAKAMVGAINQLPVNNSVAVTGWDEASMDHLIMIASAYGTPTIYCTEEFAVRMLPKEGWVSDSMKDQVWNNGRLATYKGKKVVILPQTFVDERNSQKLVDPSYAWIVPAGANEKPVKIAFEGDTHVRDVESNHDWSREIQVYKKVGVVAMLANNICVYHDLELHNDGKWADVIKPSKA